MAIKHDAVVQPYYMVDLSRKSTLLELRAMGEIRKCVEALSPLFAANILPTVITNCHELPRRPGLWTYFRRITDRSFLGGQYVILAVLSVHLGLTDLELGCLKGGSVHGIVRDSVRRIDDGTERGSYEVAPDGDVTVFGLFGNFRFPLLDLHKTDLRRIAADDDLLALFQETWFCHSPLLGRYPCGICGPCKYAIQDGFGDRVPLFGRTLHRLKAVPPARAAYRILSDPS